MLDFQKKAVDEGNKRMLPNFCKNELSVENAKKLREVLANEKTDDMVLYFNAKNGFKVLVDSLQFNQEALPILTDALGNNEQLREEFQR